MGKYEILNWSGEKAKQFGHAGRTEDPYLPEEGQEASLCTSCQALYQNKRWFFNEELSGKLAGTHKVKEVLCPACRKIEDHYVEGYLTLSGDFLVEHKAELVTLIEKEAGRVAKRSVMDRIIQMVAGGRKASGGNHHGEVGPAPGPGGLQGLQRRPELPVGRTQQVRAGLLEQVRGSGQR